MDQLAQANKKEDIKLPAVKPSPAQAAPQPAPSQASVPQLGAPVATGIPKQSALTATDYAIMGAAILVLAGLFLLGRRAVVGALTAGYADYARAKAAGNMLFLLLLTLGIGATVAIVANLWTNPYFFGPAAGLALVFLVLFIVTYISARNSARR